MVLSLANRFHQKMELLGFHQMTEVWNMIIFEYLCDKNTCQFHWFMQIITCI